MNKLSDYLLPFQSEQVHFIGPFFNLNYLPAEPLVFVDAGANFRKSSEGFALGDGDSTLVLMDEYLDPKKDFSDLSYGLSQITSQFKEIFLHGFLGHRKDHELMNLAETHRFLSNAKVLRKVFFDHAIIALSAGSWKIPLHGIFSTFVFEAANILISGCCDYSVTAAAGLKPLSSNGLSNKASGIVAIECDKPLFIFVTDASE